MHQHVYRRRVFDVKFFVLPQINSIRGISLALIAFDLQKEGIQVWSDQIMFRGMALEAYIVKSLHTAPQSS